MPLDPNQQSTLALYISCSVMCVMPVRIPRHSRTVILSTDSLSQSIRDSVYGLIQSTFIKRVDLREFEYVVVCMDHHTDSEVVSGCGLLGVERGGYTLQRLCVRQDMRGIGIATSIICCAQSLRSKVRLHVDRGDTHDRLCRFYVARGFQHVYTNEYETCLLWGG